LNLTTRIDQSSSDVIQALGSTDEMMILRQRIGSWVQSCDSEMREALEWQFLSGSKYFRPLTIFACHRSLVPGPIPDHIMTSAVVIEFFHNVSLIIDDIVDRSPERRGRATLHTQFGELNALMVSGYIVADARGAIALGGGGEEDVRDGIRTLPAALAIRDPKVGALFCKPDPDPDDLRSMANAFSAQLGEAEAYLDRIAEEARVEAAAFSIDPSPLLALVGQTRKLSGR
jgi:geranylgeranyl pyrophosphate synthase